MIPILQGAIGILLFVAILGVLVIAHEWGHFVVARIAGIRVHEFGIGFPPRAKVLSSEGETLWTLNWLPIGGFVKLEGEDGESDDPRSFSRAPFLTRQAVLVAGVLMNLVVAFVIFTLISWLANPTMSWSIGGVQPDSPAQRAGLAPGDRILSLDGRRYDAFESDRTLIGDLRMDAGRTVTLGIQRAGSAEEQVSVTLRSPQEIGPEKGALGITGIRIGFDGPWIQRSVGEGVDLGARRLVSAFRMIADGLGQLVGTIVTRPTEPPPASGPVGIAVQVTDVFWHAGPIATLYLVAILSANLALVNILPFPPLDGGRMFVILIKAIARGRVSIAAERLSYLVGFAFLFAFLVWITVFDIARIGGAVR